MAQVFAFADIAAVIAAFEPQRPTAQNPALLWNRGGDRLLHSGKVQHRFDRLLAEKNERLAAASIAPALDVKSHDWCLAARQQPLIYSADRRHLIAEQETQALLEDLNKQSDHTFVDLTTYASQKDVDLDSLKFALQQGNADLEIVYSTKDKHTTTWLSSRGLNVKTEAAIELLMRGADEDHKVDLSANMTDVPEPFIFTMAEKVSMERDVPGTVRQGKTRITFLSAAYEARVKEQQAKRTAREFSKILVHTHRYGYHRVPEDTKDAPGLNKVFFERTKAGIEDGSFSMLHSDEAPIALAFTNKLETILTELKLKAGGMVEDAWKDGKPVEPGLTEELVQTLIDGSSSQDFAQLVMVDAKYREAVQQSMRDKLEELESADLQRGNDAFNEYVRIPTTLYLTGLNAVQDPGLRRRLEEFVFEFLRKDLIPAGIQHAEDERQIRNKPIGKEMERFTQSCEEAKSLTELQAALTRFTKKQKLENVTQTDEDEVKARILQQKAKSMKRMVRASDILQNLIWILLAQEHDGLFISSGRDTTRMIKFYQAVGSEEYGHRVEAWKDRFKAGQETREDMEGMRVMADEILAAAAEKTV